MNNKENNISAELIPEWFLKYEPDLLEAIDLTNKAKAKLDSVKTLIFNKMNESDIKHIKTDMTECSIVSETQRASINAKQLKEKYPDAYEAVVKYTKINSSLRIKAL